MSTALRKGVQLCGEFLARGGRGGGFPRLQHLSGLPGGSSPPPEQRALIWKPSTPHVELSSMEESAVDELFGEFTKRMTDILSSQPAEQQAEIADLATVYGEMSLVPEATLAASHALALTNHPALRGRA